MDFTGHRLRLARVFRGLTQSELAREVAASPALLSQVETGGREPKRDLVEALAHVLGFEPGFFAAPVEDEFREDECHFRKRRTTPERLMKRAAAHGTLLGILVRHLREELELPALSLPATRARSQDDIERAAEACRESWGLALDAPVDSMGRVLERAGIVLAALDEGTTGVDSFSRFGGVSVVFLNLDGQSPSRTLLDLGHELGHGVLHRGVKTGTPEAEGQADRFAAAFLLPRAGFKREFWAPGRIDWSHLFEMKRRWRTSVQILVRRGYDLGLLDAATYRRACKYMYAQGWARGEPHEPDAERPELLRLALDTLEREAGQGSLEIAARLQWRPATFEEVTGQRGIAPATRSRVLSLEEFREKRTVPAMERQVDAGH